MCGPIILVHFTQKQHFATENTEADTRIHLASIKPDIEKICKGENAYY